MKRNKVMLGPGEQDHLSDKHLNGIKDIHRKEQKFRASLVAQWLRIHLPMQGTRVKPWSGKIPYAVEQLSLCATTSEPTQHNYRACTAQLLKPVHVEPVLCNKRRHCNKKPVHHKEEQPQLTTTRESPRTAMKTQCTQK